ncbi:F-box protein [Arabidopsis thaliana]
MTSNNKKKKTELCDLPKCLAPHILSWLPTKTAVTVSLLFMKGWWRSEMKNLSSLKFSFSDDQEEEHFVRFVDQVLRQRGNRKLDSFSLTLNDEIDGGFVTHLVDYPLDNGVEKLKLSIYDIKGNFQLSSRVFSQATLVTLKLATNRSLIWINGDDVAAAHLPCLKTLWLDDVLVADVKVFVRLLSRCPILEELVMIDMKWHNWEACFVVSASLRRLKIVWTNYVEMDEYDRCPQSVLFDTPNVLYLEYTDHIAGQYPLLKFSSLIEAKIRLEMIDEKEEEDEGQEVIVGDNATAFITGITSVRKLYLYANTIQVLHHYFDPPIPEFVYLTHLTIQSDKELGWDAIPELLSKCPHLETLVLEGLFHLATDVCGDVCPCRRNMEQAISCLVKSPVTHLEIYEGVVGKKRGEVTEDAARFGEQVRWFLMRMLHLQQVKIYGQTEDSVTALYDIATELRRLEGKASPNVQISVLQA